jgi:hypothetical protein
LRKDILNDKLFGFVQVDIETPEDLKEKVFRNDTNIQKCRNQI